MESLLIGSSTICTLELVIYEDGSIKFPRQSDLFFEPSGVEDINILRAWLHSLQNGKIISCRGRDIIRDEEGNFTSFSPWSVGYALKMNRRLFLLWDHEVESILIDGCNFIDQLHFESSFQNKACQISKNKYLVICHGFCEDNGPNYPFLCALAAALEALGYRVIIPDFRPSYKYGPTRGRSERVKIIQDDIIWCLGDELGRLGENHSLTSDQQFSRPEFVLIGHSQGGAAVGQLCSSEKAVRGANIKGIVMIGSESPVEYLPTDFNVLCGLPIEGDLPSSPPVIINADPPSALSPDNILCIHAKKDRVIHPLMIEQLSERWGCRYVELHSTARPDHPNADWADDVQHDFIAKDMLFQVIEMIANFSQYC